MAPAANPSTAPMNRAPTRRAMAYPPIEASAHTMATIIQPRTIVRDSLPADFISAAEPIASGKFDTKIATSSPHHRQGVQAQVQSCRSPRFRRPDCQQPPSVLDRMGGHVCCQIAAKNDQDPFVASPKGSLARAFVVALASFNPNTPDTLMTPADRITERRYMRRRHPRIPFRQRNSLHTNPLR